MERITYQKTLDVHKNGIQFTLQGVETGDNLSRVVELSLMASGDAIDFPLEKLLPIMYVNTPNATEPSIIECTIKDNTVVYEVLPIVEEGITEMQLKLIETSPEGATSVLVAPRFAIEVTKSNVNDGIAEQKSSFTALENAVAKAKQVYDERFLRMELDSDCIFKAYYADGTIYETDILKELFHKGESVLSQSYARGGTGVRTGEDTDNSMYYSNVSKSASLEAKEVIENSEEMLEEVRLHGVYTAFSVDFETGEVEYVSPTYNFKINLETGELETDGGAYTFEDEIGRIVVRWLEENNVDITKLQAISEKHSGEIAELQTTSLVHTENIEELQVTSKEHTTKIDEIQTDIDSLVITGTYTGTGGKQTIDLGVRPKAVLITDTTYGSTYMCPRDAGWQHMFGGLVIDGQSTHYGGLYITENGFVVDNSELGTDATYGHVFINDTGEIRQYIAWF